MTTIHFLNVGHGDCTIIEHASGHRTMIDINNGCSLDEDTRRELAAEYGISGYEYALKQGYVQTIGGSFRKEYLAEAGYDVELTDPVDYYKERWGLQPIFRYIQTHPNLDHMRGLKRLSQEGIQILNFWDTPNSRTVTDFSGNDKDEWEEYQRLRRSATAPMARHVFVQEKGKYWNQDDQGGPGDGIHVLAPARDVTNGRSATDDPNTYSYVLRLNYNGFKVVLGSDASLDAWERI